MSTALEEGLKSLAIERGVKNTNDSAPDVVDVSVHENKTMDEAPGPLPPDTEHPESENSYGEIEGYIPAMRKGKGGLQSLQDTLKESDDVLDMI